MLCSKASPFGLLQCQMSHIPGNRRGQGVSVDFDCQRLYISPFPECSCDHSPSSHIHPERADQWISREERKAICSFWTIVCLKSGVLRSFLLKQEKLKRNYKISFKPGGKKNPFDPFLSYCHIPYSCHALHPEEHEFYEDNEYLSSLPADADRTEDFEYEVRQFPQLFMCLPDVTAEKFCKTRESTCHYKKYLVDCISGKDLLYSYWF